jgi:hypothetical protein
MFTVIFGTKMADTRARRFAGFWRLIGEIRVSDDSLTVRYDGPALSQHQMDVLDFAPALLGLAELCRIANRRMNLDRATVKVLISVDVEQHCFEFVIEIIQTVWQHTKALFDGNEIEKAEAILKAIAGAASSCAGLLKVMAWLKGRKISHARNVVHNGRDVVELHVEGDHNNVIYAPQTTYQLLFDPAALAAAKATALPLTKEGYDSLTITDGGSPAAFNKIRC